MKKYLLLTILLATAGCELFQRTPLQKLSTGVNYKRDMIITVNGITREGSITMPLLEKNVIVVYSPHALDTFIMKTCGGTFDKQREWAVTTEVKGGFFGFGKKKIDDPYRQQIEILASDFHELGVCPLYFFGVSKATGKASLGYVNWQTADYLLEGTIVCNMQKRVFYGVEACSIGTGSYLKIAFNKEVYIAAEEGCPAPEKKNGAYTWRAGSGSCNYALREEGTNFKGYLNVYGEDEVVLK